MQHQTYLADKHGWSDLYPQDPLARARINEYLHFHHRNTRYCLSPFATTARRYKPGIATRVAGGFSRSLSQVLLVCFGPSFMRWVWQAARGLAFRSTGRKCVTRFKTLLPLCGPLSLCCMSSTGRLRCDYLRPRFGMHTYWHTNPSALLLTLLLLACSTSLLQMILPLHPVRPCLVRSRFFLNLSCVCRTHPTHAPPTCMGAFTFFAGLPWRQWQNKVDHA